MNWIGRKRRPRKESTTIKTICNTFFQQHSDDEPCNGAASVPPRETPTLPLGDNKIISAFEFFAIRYVTLNIAALSERTASNRPESGKKAS
jgi:hypothetical protein